MALSRKETMHPQKLHGQHLSELGPSIHPVREHIRLAKNDDNTLVNHPKRTPTKLAQMFGPKRQKIWMTMGHPVKVHIK